MNAATAGSQSVQPVDQVDRRDGLLVIVMSSQDLTRPRVDRDLPGLVTLRILLDQLTRHQTRHGWRRRKPHDIAQRPTPLHRLLERPAKQRVVALHRRRRQSPGPEAVVEVVEVLRADIFELPPADSVGRHTAGDAAIALDRPRPRPRCSRWSMCEPSKPSTDRSACVPFTSISATNWANALPASRLPPRNERLTYFGRAVIGSRPAYALNFQ